MYVHMHIQCTYVHVYSVALATNYKIARHSFNNPWIIQFVNEYFKIIRCFIVNENANKGKPTNVISNLKLVDWYAANTYRKKYNKHMNLTYRC